MKPREQRGAELELERQIEGQRKRVHELVHEVNNLAVRVHQLEDHFDNGGIVQELVEALARVAMALEQLRHGIERPRHTHKEHNVNGGDA